MFELSFFKIVHNILEWTETPSIQYLSEHESTMSRREPSVRKSAYQDFQAMDRNTRALKMYIISTYPAYFGIDLRAGPKSALIHDNYIK